MARLVAAFKWFALMVSVFLFCGAFAAWWKGDKLTAALWLALAAHIDVDRVAIAFAEYRRTHATPAPDADTKGGA